MQRSDMATDNSDGSVVEFDSTENDRRGAGDVRLKAISALLQSPNEA